MKRLLIAVLAGGISLFSLSSAWAADVVDDSFSGGNGGVSGRTPDNANEPGGKWTVIGFDSNGTFGASITGSSPAIVCLACAGNSQGVITIPIASHDAYVMPQRLTISAELHGIEPALGFYSILPGGDPADSTGILSNFTGLELGTDGSLSLYRDGGVVSSLEYTGTFNPGNFYKLSYDVDTAWGTISNVKLEGSTTDYTAFNGAGAFNDATIAYAAIAALCDQGRDNQAFAKNIVIAPSAAPPAPAPPPAADNSGTATMTAPPANPPQTIIQDVFTSGSPYGSALSGEGSASPALTPSPTNLPGSPWRNIAGISSDAREFSGKVDGVSGNGDPLPPVDLILFYNDTAAGIPLGSCNAGSLHISAGEYYKMKGSGLHEDKAPCLLAGFSSAADNPSALSTFTGLAVTGTAGAVQEYVNGSPVGRPVKFVGRFDPYAESILSYTIDTATGAITDVTFGRSGASYTFAVPKSFKSSYTAYAEIGGISSGGRFVVISSFILGSVPPASSQ